MIQGVNISKNADKLQNMLYCFNQKKSYKTTVKYRRLIGFC